MDKFSWILLLLISLIASCDGKKSVWSNEEISAMYQDFKEVENGNMNDSLFEALKEIDSSIINNPNISDSVKAYSGYLKGRYFRDKGDNNKAATFFLEATNLVQDSMKPGEGDYFYWAYETFYELERYGDCKVIYERLKSLAEAEKNYRAMVWAYTFESRIYQRQGDYEKVLEVEKKRKLISKKYDTASLNSAFLGEIRIRYHYLNDKEGAYKILDSLVSQSHRITNHYNRQIFNSYGAYLYYDGDYKKAITYYKRALEFEKKNSDYYTRPKDLAMKYSNIAEAYIELGDFEMAQAYLDTVRDFGLSTLGREIQRHYLQYQMRLNFKSNSDINQILEDLDTLNAYQNTVYEDKYNRDLEALKVANERERNLQAEKYSAEFKNFRLQIIMYSAIGILLFLILIMYLFNRQKHFKLERENLNTRQRLLRAQMNPHFTFNTLYAIKDLIQKDQDKALQYMLKFSKLLRRILENTTHNYVLLEKELESLRAYLDLQQLGSSIKFAYDIRLNGIEEDIMFIPPMILQPLVENSIQHGFSGINYQGRATITLSMEEEFIACEVEDDGRGIDVTSHTNRKLTSTHLISEFLHKSTKTKIKVLNKSDFSEDETGVIVRFLIPYKLTGND
ncbi:histidine kinase [Aureisphaera galaxeae]|uniref:tetratricopeptide repeat-containing sensor histidine kinase n=1 Tax=Aureisphaera galaxeae TaxID=1538023 RepID=UPI00234FDD04|nr:histidine kinase [Aureisphaera galaxeae]MDC8002500.1 histidine kinase [Aureisphaera galaxeae]